MLLVLLLGIADFGRVFSAGITLEAAARNAAEAAAQEYVQLKRNGSTPLGATDYEHLHSIALEKICAESTVLSNYTEGGGGCTEPFAAVCVHDLPAPAADPMPPNGDPNCGAEAAAAPGQCPTMTDDPADPADDGDAWVNTKNDGGVSLPESLPYVEVRLCYRFTTLFNISGMQLPFGWDVTFGEVWLERQRSFVAGLY